LANAVSRDLVILDSKAGGWRDLHLERNFVSSGTETSAGIARLVLLAFLWVSNEGHQHEQALKSGSSDTVPVHEIHTVELIMGRFVLMNDG